MNFINNKHHHSDCSDESREPVSLGNHSRRFFLQRVAALGAAGLLLPGLLAACGHENGTESPDESGRLMAGTSCAESADLSQQEITRREAVRYVDESPKSAQMCSNCRFFEQSGAGADCGTCEIVAGPIAPAGYCSAWVAQSGEVSGKSTGEPYVPPMSKVHPRYRRA